MNFPVERAKPWGIGLLQHQLGHRIDTVPTDSDEQEYHTHDEDDLYEQNPWHPPFLTMWDQLLIRDHTSKRTNNENSPIKRTTGTDRMNHLVRFAKRTNGGKNLFRILFRN